MRHGSHHCAYLQRAWDKYGESSFEFFVLEECEPYLLIKTEQSWLPEEKTLEALIVGGYYNSSPTAGSPLGYRHTEETKKRMRGREVSEETRKKHREQVQTESKREKNRVASTGRKHSEETKNKMRETRNRMLAENPEIQEKMKARKGTWNHTDEAKRKISERALANSEARMREWERRKKLEMRAS